MNASVRRVNRKLSLGKTCTGSFVYSEIILSLLACMIRDSAEKEVRSLCECVCVCACVCEYVDA
jgi:hypothetical protein